ncbi:MAG: chemotaxis protein CheW [Pseudomonadota bacterium]
MAAIVENVLAGDLSCVVMRLGATSLLLPSVCVAEVMPWRQLRPVPGMPPWLLGVVGWRGSKIPVLRFEALNEQEPATAASCLAVMNRCGSPSGQSFYAFAIDGLPRIVQVGEEDVAEVDETLGAAERAAAHLGTESVRIPDLAYIENQLLSLLRRTG